MSLQFTSIDDAFAPLSQKKRRERRPLDEVGEDAPPPPQQQPGQVPIQTQPALVVEPTHRTFADEVLAVQPYLNNLFMLVVLGMLYDIRQAAVDCRTHFLRQSA